MDMKYDQRTSTGEATAPKRQKIQGVFSTQTVVKVGTGTTTRRTIQKTYWYATQMEDGQLEVQPLNRNFVPSGPKRIVPRDEFLEKFSPEPEFYVSTVFPKMQELEKTVIRGEKNREQGQLYSAEFEFNTALKVDEENVRANFGLGLTYLDRGERNKANDIFERLVKLDAAFDEQHKHLFNEFGINLRKNQMYDQALDYYKRAIKLTREDEHLWLNIARAGYEKGDHETTVDALRHAIALRPDMEECKQFWAFLQKKNIVSADYPEGPPGTVV